MIRINEDKQLVLTPRAFAPGSDKDITLHLERAYVCPLCGCIIKGAFKTDRSPDRMLNLNTFTAGNEHTMDRPDYVNEYVKLPTGEKLQFFQDAHHCGEGELKQRVKDAVANRCKLVKFYFEPSIPRLFNRFLKDLAKLELYGGYVQKVFYKDHEEYIKKIRGVLEDRVESKQLFLAHHPYGRFTPDVVGDGPAGYLGMYKFEHAMLQTFYSHVIGKTHERIH